MDKIGLNIKEEMADETGSAFATTDVTEEKGPLIYYDGLVHVKLEEELLIPDDGAKDSVIEKKNNMKDEKCMDYKKFNKPHQEGPHFEYETSKYTITHQEDKKSQLNCSFCIKDSLMKMENNFKDEMNMHFGELKSPYQEGPHYEYDSIENHLITHKEDKKAKHNCFYCLEIKEEMPDETGSDCWLVEVKQERELLIPDDVHSIGIEEEEEGSQFNCGSKDSIIEMKNNLKEEKNIDLEKIENYQEGSHYEFEAGLIIKEEMADATGFDSKYPLR
ncbi:uncharacterized protein [Halyomorpha halys]|uniref:uncharacterized protein isoform X8 n=1 Tax=Halyomorpha halys TaxID=286706 RepID=UPI0034D261FF